MSKRKVYSKSLTPIVEYKEWVIENYGKLSNEEERQLAFDIYYKQRSKNKLNVIN